MVLCAWLHSHSGWVRARVRSLNIFHIQIGFLSALNCVCIIRRSNNTQRVLLVYDSNYYTEKQNNGISRSLQCEWVVGLYLHKATTEFLKSQKSVEVLGSELWYLLVRKRSVYEF